MQRLPSSMPRTRPNHQQASDVWTTGQLDTLGRAGWRAGGLAGQWDSGTCGPRNGPELVQEDTTDHQTLGRRATDISLCALVCRKHIRSGSCTHLPLATWPCHARQPGQPASPARPMADVLGSHTRTHNVNVRNFFLGIS